MPFERLFRILKYKLEEFIETEHDQATYSRGESRDSWESKHNTESVNQETVLELQYFANLELKPTNDFKRIKSQYRILMKKYHPDRFGGDRTKIEMAREVTSKLNEAYAYFEKKLGN